MCPGCVRCALAACALLPLLPPAHAGLPEGSIPEIILIEPAARQSQLVLDHEAQECQVSHMSDLFEFNLGRGAGGSSFMGPAVGRAKDDDAPYQGTFVNESVEFSKLWIPSIVRSAMWAYHYTRTQISIVAKHAVDIVVAYQM